VDGRRQRAWVTGGDESGLRDRELGADVVDAGRLPRQRHGTVPLAEVSPQVKRYLTEQKKQQLAQAFVEQVKQKAKIEVLI